jgi:hypothetical protein
MAVGVNKDQSMTKCGRKYPEGVEENAGEKTGSRASKGQVWPPTGGKRRRGMLTESPWGLPQG